MGSWLLAQFPSPVSRVLFFEALLPQIINYVSLPVTKQAASSHRGSSIHPKINVQFHMTRSATEGTHGLAEELQMAEGKKWAEEAYLSRAGRKASLRNGHSSQDLKNGESAVRR